MCFLKRENKTNQILRNKALITALILLFLVSLTNISYSQMPFIGPAIFGGPSAGWFFNDVSDLNEDLRNSGFPELSKSGYLTLGGAGYIDLPMGKNFLRLGGTGLGFTTSEEKKINDTLTKAVTYGLGMGGVVVEYVINLGRLDLICGATFSVGALVLDLYQYGPNAGNYGTIFGEFKNNSSTDNITRNFRSVFFGVHPQIGTGVLVKEYLYLRLSGGYQFSVHGKWTVDNFQEVKNFPTGIKANGFTINFSINLGLFFRG